MRYDYAIHPTADIFVTAGKSIEHRREPRFRRLLEVRIGSLELTTANVSLHGMQIVCPVMRYRRIEPDVRRGQLSAQVAFPRDAQVDAALSVRYFSPHRDEVLVGVRMDLTDPDALARWAAYIGGLAGAS